MYRHSTAHLLAAAVLFGAAALGWFVARRATRDDAAQAAAEIGPAA